ncbi:PAS domain S-box-containing protein [Humidesulfovibrio mexicanus]|uniref:histidine kinase n=1 Tax=Humidesulfovibrio mexicanus TaxID=147047 RepID=A0A239CPF9_9BACT|nr:PAS domain S-box protein [Humidesulfovibrio mexicanus]SNS21752.1 PAS domain S-box-containing protein [Humidesulfovibrio mexicanus]
MFSPFLVLGVLAGYMGLMLLLAKWAERSAEAGRSITNRPLVYALSLATYCTSWTYYGSVGKAVVSGPLFLTIYIGPTICAALWWVLVRKLTRIKTSFHVTSIADLLAARYGKSHRVAALATAVAFVGSVPYVALQIKSVTSTFSMLAGDEAELLGVVGPLVVTVMIVYAIVLGVRRIDPTDRHPGMVATVTAEAVLKLAAMLAVGAFAVWLLLQEAGGPASGLTPERLEDILRLRREEGGAYVLWAGYLVLSLSAIVFLPHQFHLAVVENADERHILTASWVFPLYLLCINLAVVPVAMAGLDTGLSPARADTFVLGLPLAQGNAALALLVFLGGFAAAMSMVMVSSVTNAVMLTNHVLLPVISKVPALAGLKRRLLQCRWACVAVLVLTAYWFERAIGDSYILVNIGIIAFGAVLQFAPAVLGGIFWRSGTRSGALAGLSGGFLLWMHTMLLPALSKGGHVWSGPVSEGLFGLSFLRSESLFGMTALDPVAHSVFWTLLFNTGLYVLVSLNTRQSQEEIAVLPEFTGLPGLGDRRVGPGAEDEADLSEKRALMERPLREYLPRDESRALIDECLQSQKLAGRTRISLTALAALYGEVERAFSGVVGAAAAHKALSQAGVFTAEETGALSDVYGGMLARLRISPDEMARRIDYHIEREHLLTRHAAELKETLRLRDQEIVERKRVEDALRLAEENYRGIFMSAPEGIFQTTLKGRILSANPAMARILGYESPQELMELVGSLGDQVYAFPLARERVLRTLEDKGVLDGMELAMRKKDGSLIWCSIIARATRDETGRVVRIDGLLSDVTEKKRALEELRESEARIRALFDATSDSVILMDPEGVVLAINAHGARRRGLMPEDMIGRYIYDHLPPNAAEIRRLQVREALRTKSPRTFEEDRQGFFYSITIYPILDEGGNVRQLASFSRDITAQRESEATILRMNESLEERVRERTRQLEAANAELTSALEQLTRAHKQLVESEKMASLGGLVAGVAHEINTPVGVGVTAASHLEARTQGLLAEYRSGGLKRASLEEYLGVCDESTRMILSNLRRAAELIRSFKQVAVDRSTEERRSFKLRAYLDEVLLSLRPHLKKTEHEVVLICDPELTLDSYPGALSQVVTNLVMNSLVHAFEPGVAGRITITALEKGRYVLLIYADDGAGIAPEHLDKIFEPFYTTRRGKGGTGLGLHILYNLVTQKLGGEVRCESQPGRGATFTLTLPQGGPDPT